MEGQQEAEAVVNLISIEKEKKTQKRESDEKWGEATAAGELSGGGRQKQPAASNSILH